MTSIVATSSASSIEINLLFSLSREKRISYGASGKKLGLQILRFGCQSPRHGIEATLTARRSPPQI
ncbi:hypothetical protein ACC718_39610, partial [Rhizobium ruizarguesonis]